MRQRLGQVIYWFCTVVALLAIALVALVGQGSFTENVVGMYVLGIGFGLLVIGVGWIIRFILTGNKRVLP